MRLSDVDTSRRFRATLVATTRITPQESLEEVRELVLEIDGEDFDFAPGQLIGVVVSGPHDLGHAEHFRVYSIADVLKRSAQNRPLVDICVKRCHYIDEYSGEAYDGIASNYLCDLSAGDSLTVTGPYGIPWPIPTDRSANLLMIGMGTGIAPFRGLVRHIYEHVGNWQGKVRLFYGARTGLETLYMNDERDDFANYYDHPTFEAFKALSPRPHWDAPVEMEAIIDRQRGEVWELLADEKTYVYVAGLEQIRATLDKIFSDMAGGSEKWTQHKTRLVEQGRWMELLY